MYWTGQPFLVLRVDEQVREGYITLYCEGAADPLLGDFEDYIRSKAAIARADGVPITDVQLVGMTLVLNAQGVPVRLAAD
ncbi:MAG: hypothetical protein FJ035_07040 [Chloroflexi bacterium]|nr:hypothetical protein [Chloroflexota bacterium]